ncbi:hypothetical protein [Moraxella oblonga]|uniref:hypothetical protein n=1 Tax=Moraxella oblonga TaxID=200413 RepID=UPI00082E6FF2|nr:hypothetical protein [Moraxella oblonga]
MLIELPPHIEQLVIAKAQSEQLSVIELIEKWASENKKDDVLLTDFFKKQPPIEAFNGIDPVAYQRAMRDEW